MEAALGAELMEVVHQQCIAFRVRPDRWYLVAAIAPAWEQLAAMMLAERIQEERGVGEDVALGDAAESLGLRFETLRSRYKRAS